MTIESKYLARRFRDPEAEAVRIAQLQETARQLRDQGKQVIAGVDEVGRGPLAGPVVAAAVVFPPGVTVPGIDDSKRLTARQREALVPVIEAAALATGLGRVDAEIIDTVNIRKATHMAMMAAVDNLHMDVDHVLVDGNGVPNAPWPQTAIHGGDRLCYSIAAASILAKVHRDGLMVAFDERYPEYGFAGHKGYGAASHCAAIARYGPCPIHRRSFSWGQGRA